MNPTTVIFWRGRVPHLISGERGPWIIPSNIILWRRNSEPIHGKFIGIWFAGNRAIIQWRRTARFNNSIPVNDWTLHPGAIHWKRGKYAIIPNTSVRGTFSISGSSTLVFTPASTVNNFVVDGHTNVRFAGTVTPGGSGSVYGDFVCSGRTIVTFNGAQSHLGYFNIIGEALNIFDSGVSTPSTFECDGHTDVKFDTLIGQSTSCISGSGVPPNVFVVENYVF